MIVLGRPIDALFSPSSPSEQEERELENLSAMIAQMKRRHKAQMCSNGMSGQPQCRTLSQAMSDIRRRCEQP